MAQPLWKTVWRFLINLNMPYYTIQQFVPLGIYPQELKTYVHTKTCTHTVVGSPPYGEGGKKRQREKGKQKTKNKPTSR